MSMVQPARLAPRPALPIPGVMSLYVPVTLGSASTLSRVRASLRDHELPSTPLQHMAVHRALERLERALEFAEAHSTGSLAVFTTLGGQAWTSILPLEHTMPFRLFVDRRPVTWPARAVVYDHRHLDAIDERFAPAPGPLALFSALR